MIEILRCLFLPIHEKTLVVPYAAVAEIVSFDKVANTKSRADWLLGTFEWRKMQIPLIALEKMDQSPSEFIHKPNLQIAVINRISENSQLDFIGVLLQSIPRMHRMRRTDIKQTSEAKESYLLMEVLARDQPSFIPNLPWIEAQINSLQSK